MRKKLALLALATAAVTVVTAATSASADNRIIKGAYVYYDPARNMFGIGDTEADGRTAYLEVSVNGGPRQTFGNHNGSGTWRDVYSNETGIRDGNTLAWRAKVGGGATSSWVYEQA
ncbi:hypothetical protein [Streptomyces sp. NRRL F-2580]|uniref:hypothetical protein n=1 Tax=Streptomyces sp. NRRL F-2580 TaxID=1463841 RepID=UPI0004C89246|nr:hypothetical protein [Streptomyces sp. NRRL F-2580]